MQIFETILVLLLSATLLSAFARRLSIPYPTLLALGGALIAFLPGAPRLQPPPELILALFVAPVLLDAAYDASLRDLRRDWRTVSSLVLVAVALTTAGVAVVARLLFPEMPWPVAIALGALVAPPDAVAALAVLRQVSPPFRIRMVLEGESLLNDASALLIYRLAVAAMAAGSFSLTSALPTFGLVVIGSVAVGWLLTWPVNWMISRLDDAPSSVIIQFVMTFGVWLIAERLELSGVVTVVVFGMALARREVTPMPARLRIPSFAIWETVTFILNVLAFTLIGLQIRPILEGLEPGERTRFIAAGFVILAAVIGIRLAWAFLHHAIGRLFRGRDKDDVGWRGALVMGWSGMRGIVTLAAAIALPVDFPHRDFIQFAAAIVVLGTLVLQGLTLRPLLCWLRLPADETIESESHTARKTALKAFLKELEGETSPAAERLRHEYEDALSFAHEGGDPRDSAENELRRRAVAACRRALDEMRSEGVIGDDAYHLVEEELDWLELSAREVA